MRTIVDIPEDAIRRLDALAVKAKRSRAAEIRSAIERHLSETADNSWIYGEGFGYWKDRDDIGDAVEYQRSMREDRDPA
jgi:hypothetical protein